MPKIINISKNYQTIVDDEDYPYLNQFKWTALGSGGLIRPVRYKRFGPRKQNKRQVILLYRELLGILHKPKVLVDHINGNPLDNRRCNLRFCDTKGNTRNRIKTAKKTSSKYKGVCWCKKHKKWIVHIGVNNKIKFLGYFENEVEAAKAYNEAAIKYFKHFANLNNV